MKACYVSFIQCLIKGPRHMSQSYRIAHGPTELGEEKSVSLRLNHTQVSSLLFILLLLSKEI